MNAENCRVETQTMFVRLGPIVAVQFHVQWREMRDVYGERHRSSGSVTRTEEGNSRQKDCCGFDRKEQERWEVEID